jgi:hypothetical protein
MILRLLCAFLAVTICIGCKSDTKPEKAKGKAGEKEQAANDPSGDAAFQTFLGTLRKAVIKRDVSTLAELMAPSFGYRWDQGPPGETPFDYWGEHNLWAELSSIVKERWVPHDGFMVVPPQFASGEGYAGYRAGATMVGQNWRFAYFVPAPPPTAPPPTQ